MSPLKELAIDMAAEKIVIITPELTVGHVVPGMPAVYGNPDDDCPSARRLPARC